MRKILVSAYVRQLFATLIYFTYLQSVVYSGSSESDNNSDCD